MIRVVLVDDQALVRGGFRSILDRQDGIEVVGEAADGIEALTNVLKHSAGEWVRVAVRADAESVVLEVTDGGPARGGAELPSGGQGLVGMRERVALFGGRLDAGPDGAGWRVRAELPLENARVRG